MSFKKKKTLMSELTAGGILVGTLKIIALICLFVGFIFAVAILATTREGFGFRGFLTYAGTGLISGIAIFELAEIIRWLQQVHERFDLYDKIDG